MLQAMCARLLVLFVWGAQVVPNGAPGAPWRHVAVDTCRARLRTVPLRSFSTAGTVGEMAAGVRCARGPAVTRCFNLSAAARMYMPVVQSWEPKPAAVPDAYGVCSTAHCALSL
jgi:hypothetical protein